MRESIGGAFLFNLVLVFLGVYVAILAFAVVYARAFNTKNHVITLLEQYEGYDNADEKIDNYMSSRSGGVTDITYQYCCDLYREKYNRQDSDCANNVKHIQGGCIFEFKDTKSQTHYYVVTTFMRVDVPVISALTRYWPISGETTVLYDRKKSGGKDNIINKDHINRPPDAEITDPKPELEKK